jgi:adenylate cyclase
VREFVARDRSYQVDAVALAVRMAQVDVRGLTLEGIPVVRWLRPPVVPLLGSKSALGFRHLAADLDGAVRGSQLLLVYLDPKGDPHLIPSMALAAAMQLAGAHTLTYEHGQLKLSPTLSIPMDETGYSLTPWSSSDVAPHGRGSFQRVVSAWQLLRNVLDVQSGQLPHYRSDVAGRAVVLADMSSTGPSWVRTPVGPGVAPGAVEGQVLSNLLAGSGISRVEPQVDLLATFVLAFLGAFLALSFSGFFQSVLGAGLYFASLLLSAFGYWAFARHLFLVDHRWIAVFAPLLALCVTFVATSLYALRTQRQMREFVEEMLGRYVSPEVTRQVFKNVSLMRPEKRQVTLLFCDLEGFNRFLQELPPEKLVELLNEYFTEMTAIVRQSGGQVEYVGDALLAFFGAPVRTERHAAIACQSARAMRSLLAQRQEDWSRRFGVRVNFRIGICSGEVLVGDMGSRLQSNYTVMGEPVSLAERLEAANRSYGTSVLVAESTRAHVKDPLVFREVDQVILKDRPLRLFELLGAPSEVDEAKLKELRQFDEALKLFRQRRFAEAEGAFKVLAESDPVSRLYVTRCEKLGAVPPPPDWDGSADLRQL